MGIFSIFGKRKSQEKAHLKALMEVAMADGEIDKFEYEYLLSIAQKMGITEKELQALKDHSVHYEFKVPKDKNESFNRLYELICMMMIDGEIHKREKQLCSVFARKLGFTMKNIDELIYSVEQNVSMGNSAEETLKRVSFIINQ
jgi:uncharacterized tellurite resistance protein B-like protein